MAEVIPLELKVVRNSYLSLNGPDIDSIGVNGVLDIPAQCAAKRLDRDGGHGFHCTFINPRDVKQLIPNGSKKERQQQLWGLKNNIVSTFGDPTRWERPIDLGLGKVTERDAVAYFRVLHWPQGQHMRHSLGLAKAYFHVTLGFDPQDVHTYKGPATLVALSEEAACSPAQLRQLLPVVHCYANDTLFTRAMFFKCLSSNDIALMRSLFWHCVWSCKPRLVMSSLWLLLRALWRRWRVFR